MPTPNSVGHTIAIRDLNIGSKEWARVFGTFPPGEKKLVPREVSWFLNHIGGSRTTKLPSLKMLVDP